MQDQPGATAATFHETVQWATAIVLTTPGSQDDAGIKSIAKSLGPDVKGEAPGCATRAQETLPSRDRTSYSACQIGPLGLYPWFQ
jgi:hypothetical protein